MNDDRAKLEALPAFDDPHVQIVYRILCDTDLVPPPDEHWEGFTARHVVAALASAQAASAEPVAQDANAEIKALYVQHFGSDRGWLDHDGSFFIEGVRVGRTTPAPAVAPAAVTDEQINALIRAQTFWGVAAKETGLIFGPELHSFARDVLALATAAKRAAVTEADEAGGMVCRPNGLMFDAFGEPRTRYVRVTLDGSHCVMHPSEGDTYLKDARESDDESPYVVADVWLSEREFDDLGEFNGF